MKLRFLLLVLLPLLIRMEDEGVTCFSCEMDEDCAVGYCVANQCTDESGLFDDGCFCQADVECNSGLCQRSCEHALDKNATCTADSDCGHGGCSVHALCIEVGSAAESSNRIMPVWVAFIVIVGSIGALLAFLCATRRESFYECCCDGILTCCCFICELC